MLSVKAYNYEPPEFRNDSPLTKEEAKNYIEYVISKMAGDKFTPWNAYHKYTGNELNVLDSFDDKVYNNVGDRKSIVTGEQRKKWVKEYIEEMQQQDWKITGVDKFKLELILTNNYDKSHTVHVNIGELVCCMGMYCRGQFNAKQYVYTISNPSELDTLFTSKEKQTIVIRKPRYVNDEEPFLPLQMCIDDIKIYNKYLRYSIDDKSYSDGKFQVKNANNQIIEAKFGRKSTERSRIVYNAMILRIVFHNSDVPPICCTNLSTFEDFINKTLTDVDKYNADIEHQYKARQTKVADKENKLKEELSECRKDFCANLDNFEAIFNKIIDKIYSDAEQSLTIQTNAISFDKIDTNGQIKMSKCELAVRFTYMVNEYVKTGKLEIPTSDRIKEEYASKPFIATKKKVQPDDVVLILPAGHVCINKYEYPQAFKIALDNGCFNTDPYGYENGLNDGLIISISDVKWRITDEEQRQTVLDACEIVEAPSESANCVAIRGYRGFILTKPEKIVKAYTTSNGMDIDMDTLLAQARHQNKSGTVYELKVKPKTGNETERKFISVPYPYVGRVGLGRYTINEIMPKSDNYVSDVVILDGNNTVVKGMNGTVFTTRYSIGTKYFLIFKELPEYKNLKQSYSDAVGKFKSIKESFIKRKRASEV